MVRCLQGCGPTPQRVAAEWVPRSGQGRDREEGVEEQWELWAHSVDILRRPGCKSPVYLQSLDCPCHVSPVPLGSSLRNIGTMSGGIGDVGRAERSLRGKGREEGE